MSWMRSQVMRQNPSFTPLQSSGVNSISRRQHQDQRRRRQTMEAELEQQQQQDATGLREISVVSAEIDPAGGKSMRNEQQQVITRRRLRPEPQRRRADTSPQLVQSALVCGHDQQVVAVVSSVASREERKENCEDILAAASPTISSYFQGDDNENVNQKIASPPKLESARPRRGTQVGGGGGGDSTLKLLDDELYGSKLIGCQAAHRDSGDKMALKTTKTTTTTANCQASTRPTARRSLGVRRITNQASNSMRSNVSYRPIYLLSLSFLVSIVVSLTMSASTQVAGLVSSGHQYFEVQPEAQHLAPVGQDARLRCLIRNRQGECLWLRNGKNIGPIKGKYSFSRSPEDGDCSLMIRNVSVQLDDGQWQCQVTASDVDQDTLQSREVNLVVLVAPEKPQIKNMTQGANQKERVILEENKTKFVVCEIRGGNPAPQIEWILDGKNITKEAQSSSQLIASGSSSWSSGSLSNGNQRVTQSKLKMSDIKRTMNGKNLTCVGVHQTINQVASVELDVQYVPTVSVVQREYSIVEGSPLTISCQVDANPPPSHVNWRLVSEGLTKSSAGSHISQPTKPGPQLEFERISRDYNQNIFECLAQNSYGISLPVDVKLNVLFAPYLVNTSNSESVLVGSQTQLACIFEGNPEPEVRWHYTDPLSKSAAAVQLETGSTRQQTLTIRNVTYRNEGDYHCEARNQINGVNYGVRSSNIMLDVYGEPQFLLKSPAHAKAIQGAKSDLSLTFCSDPPPVRVYWQFGSLRLEVRLNGVNNGHQQTPSASSGQQTLPGGSKQSSISQRYLVHPLQSLQKRETGSSKLTTCFEATLTLLDPELTDQRDYSLVVQNERGSQTAQVRLRVSSPISPVLMITSAFATIFGMFLCTVLVMFLLKKRKELLRSSANGHANGNGRGPNGQKNIDHLVNGNGGQSGGGGGGLVATIAGAVASVAGANGSQANGKQQSTRGIVNGLGNGLANQASNPASGQQPNSLSSQHMNEVSVDAKSSPRNGGGGGMHHGHLMSMASSDTSGDQKQLLANSSASERNSSSSGSSPNHCGIIESYTQHASRSTANSTPIPMNHISVDDVIHDDGVHSTTYQPAESVTNDMVHELRTSPKNYQSHESGALIYANLNYSDHLSPHQLLQQQQQQHQAQHSPSMNSMNSQHLAASNLSQGDQLISGATSPQQHNTLVPSSKTNTITTSTSNQSPLHHQSASPKAGLRSSVGATIAMMNSLAAAAAANGSGLVQAAGSLQANASLRPNGKVRKPGPPKPPKPSIQQRSRFYQQQQQANDGGGLVMIGTAMGPMTGGNSNEDGLNGSSNNELAAEYSRLAFTTRAEL